MTRGERGQGAVAKRRRVRAIGGKTQRIHINTWRLGSKIADRALRHLGVRLRRTQGISYWQAGQKTVGWNPQHGFATLLHEVAHVALQHVLDSNWAAQVGKEAEAWSWAEESAHLWGLPFDYRRANWAFSTYTRRVPGAKRWRMTWRYK